MFYTWSFSPNTRPNFEMRRIYNGACIPMWGLDRTADLPFVLVQMSESTLILVNPNNFEAARHGEPSGMSLKLGVL